jgi:predicted ArsR family transcriptional regulator
MDAPSPSDPQESILQVLKEQRRTDIYALAQAVGLSPQTVQHAIQDLAQRDLVSVSGRHVRRTRWDGGTVKKKNCPDA